MIDEQLEEIERALKSDSLVIFSDFQRIYTSPNSAYVKGKVRFMNNSFLNLFHHVCSKEGKLIIDYRYHYMDSKNIEIFRYDNAPHYPNIKSFPDHKHTSAGTKESNMPFIGDIISEIHQYIIKELLFNV